MKAFIDGLRKDIPLPFQGALAISAAFMAFVAWDQSHWWRAKEDYSFGWLVPAFVIFVFYDRLPTLRARLAACAAPGSPRAGGWQGLLLNIAVGLTLTIGALLFLIGAFYRSGAGSSYPGTLALTLGSATLILVLLFLNAPLSSSRPTADAPLWKDARVLLVVLFTFPTFVWLVSAPMVSVIENNLSKFLLAQVTAIVSFVFDVLGLPIEKQGNVLVLPLGRVGVEDACSGIRSLTACLFAGSFLGAVFLDRFYKKIALFICALFFAFCTNLLRSLFLTAWAYHYGPDAIEGTVHDIAGYAVLGLTIAGLLCLIPIFNLKFTSDNATDPS